jgi:hypothetical protein
MNMKRPARKVTRTLKAKNKKTTGNIAMTLPADFNRPLCLLVGRRGTGKTPAIHSPILPF